ncbi:hypothetical protein YUBABA_02470 [Serratia phage vB_SmaM-Yubaba]|nr:hypothetical protein YUBABA_02470 [Serratia phage vB_SmaM-Yubaba]
MLQATNASGITENMVTYKFKISELADLFETFTPEQSHIALEGALNIIFGRPSGVLQAVKLEGEEAEPEQTPEELQQDHETQIVGEVAYALYCHQMTAEAAALVPDGCATAWTIPDDYENTEEYQRMEEMFRGIVAHISNAIAADKFNQDVITLHGEMEFFSRIELYTYNYNTNIEILSVTIAAMLS